MFCTAPSALESITPSPPVSRSSREASPPRRVVPQFAKVNSLSVTRPIQYLYGKDIVFHSLPIVTVTVSILLFENVIE